MTYVKLLPIALLTLCACGGGGETTGQQGGMPSGAEFPVVTGDNAPNVAVPTGSQQIIGSHAVSLFSIREIQMQKTNGAEKANGAVTLADGTSIFTGSSGYSSNGVQQDNFSEIVKRTTNNTYNAGTIYKGGISDDANNIFYVITQGVYGVATPAGSMPSSNSAIYSGDAVGVFRDTGNESFNNGQSVVNANFGSGTADVTLSQFDTNSAPFDQVNITGMSINGNRMDGGTVELRDNGAVVAGLGPNTQSTATGAFFGNIVGGFPLEVGGQVYARGDTGAFIGTFLAK